MYIDILKPTLLYLCCCLPLRMETLGAVLLFLAVLSPVFGRELVAQKDIYSTLDVQAALRVARGEAVETAKGKTLEVKTWSIPLVHRDAMKGSSNGKELSYKERMQQRLKRDAARVAAINSRLELAVNGIKRSSLRPDSSSASTMSESDFQSPVVSGMDQGSGEYFSRIGVGSPQRDQLMVLDTGSDVSWIQCNPCSDCYQQADPIYTPASSSTFKLVGCQASLCQELDVSGCSRNGSCMYQVSYGDGSYTLGNFATETLTLGGTTVPNMAIGCGHDNEGLFVGASGLLGLGGGSLSFPSQLTDESGKIFSYCLVDRDSESSSTLQFGRAAVPNGAVVAPMLKNSRLDTFYYVSFSGISVGGKMLSISDSVFGIDASGNGGVIVDSGTAVTRLQTAAYDSLRDAFRAGTKNLPSTDGVSLFDTCYDLSSKDSVDVPTVGFHFPGGGSMSLPAKNYLVPVDSMGTFCFAFAPTSSSLSIVGNIQQQGTRVSFDRVNNQVGFAVNKC